MFSGTTNALKVFRLFQRKSGKQSMGEGNYKEMIQNSLTTEILCRHKRNIIPYTVL
jgi:hypothetical protein